jgi:hypothetical protein
MGERIRHGISRPVQRLIAFVIIGLILGFFGGYVIFGKTDRFGTKEYIPIARIFGIEIARPDESGLERAFRNARKSYDKEHQPFRAMRNLIIILTGVGGVAGAVIAGIAKK